MNQEESRMARARRLKKYLPYLVFPERDNKSSRYKLIQGDSLYGSKYKLYSGAKISAHKPILFETREAAYDFLYELAEKRYAVDSKKEKK